MRPRDFPQVTLALALLSAGLAAQSGGTTPALAQELRRQTDERLQGIARQVDGVIGYTVVDLTSGDRLTRLDTVPFPTASTIKLTILYELFKQADEGRIRLDEARTLDRRQAVGGTGVLVELGTPSLSLGDYATLMVLVSDNTATNVLIDVVGMDAVNARMRALGLTGTKLRRRMMDLEAARRGDENVSTPAEIARLLEVIYKGEGLRPASRDAVLAMLKKRKSTPLTRGLPPGVEVANKPGELDGVRVDAGIVFAKERPYIFAAMLAYLQDDEAGEQAIENASRTAYNYFKRLGEGSEYGRPLRD